MNEFIMSIFSGVLAAFIYDLLTKKNLSHSSVNKLSYEKKLNLVNHILIKKINYMKTFTRCSRFLLLAWILSIYLIPETILTDTITNFILSKELVIKTNSFFKNGSFLPELLNIEKVYFDEYLIRLHVFVSPPIFFFCFINFLYLKRIKGLFIRFNIEEKKGVQDLLGQYGKSHLLTTSILKSVVLCY